MNDYIYNDSNNGMSLAVLYVVGGYVTYEIAVFTDDYSGKTSFCLSIEDVNTIIAEVDGIYKRNEGQIIIRDTESDSYIEITEEKDLVVVSGQLGGSINDNFLRFKFKADQTIFFILKNQIATYALYL